MIFIRRFNHTTRAEIRRKNEKNVHVGFITSAFTVVIVSRGGREQSEVTRVFSPLFFTMEINKHRVRCMCASNAIRLEHGRHRCTYTYASANVRNVSMGNNGGLVPSLFARS